jgi:hypothetical protein
MTRPLSELGAAVKWPKVSGKAKSQWYYTFFFVTDEEEK